MPTTSPSEPVIFVGGPFDGSEYIKAEGVSAYPYFLHVPHGDRLHLYRLSMRKKGKKLFVRYQHKGVMLQDGASIQ